MMKRAVQLLVLAGALLSVGALAQFGKNTTFNFYFPKYAAIYTNVTQVDFFNFNSTTGTEGALSANSISGYYPSTKNGVVECLDAATGLPSNYTINGTAATASLTCNFAPNAITKDQGFSVSGYSNAATTDTDGELLIITNASNFATGVSTSGSISSATIYVIPGYVDASPSVVDQADTGEQDVTAAAFDQDDAYATQYTFAKVIPLLFYAGVDVLNTLEITTAETMTVTWTMTSP